MNGNFKKIFNLSDIKINENSAIPALWARKKIASLMNLYRLSIDTSSSNIIKKEIIDISENYNIISKFTSFIAIESEVVNKKGYLLSTNIGNQHPKNWKINKSKKSEKLNPTNFRHMPQTATNNPLHLLIGLCLLFVGLFIKRFNENYS